MTLKKGQLKIEVPAGGAKTLQVDIAQVLARQFDDAVGDPVTPAEVMLFTKKKCQDCWGKGQTKKSVLDDQGKVVHETEEVEVDGAKVQKVKLDARGKPMAKQMPVLCRCGVKALVVKHGDELIRVEGRLFWRRRDLLKNPEPTPGDATRMRAMLESGLLAAALEEQGLSLPEEAASAGES